MERRDRQRFSCAELIDAFELRRVVKSPSVFDVEKFKWVNSQHMKLMTVEELMPQVKDQMLWNNMLKDDVALDDSTVTDFAIAATALAKQMMETTKDAAVNAKEVLGYGLPASFDELTDVDAKNMIVMGHFYQVGNKIIEEYNAGIFPNAGPGVSGSVPGCDRERWKKTRKRELAYSVNYMTQYESMAKETGIKGRNLFHPRLALG
jgi:glutamyl/glutaminyl-tRNA synthetase